MTSERRAPDLGSWMTSRIRRTGVPPRYAAYLIIVLWLVAIVVFGVIEYLVEPETFDSPLLGMWWALQTVTTVGYGDVVPDQTAGKLMAAVLMLGGLSLLAVVTGAITSAFVASAQSERQKAGDDPVMRELAGVRAELEGVKGELGRIRAGGNPADP